MVEYISKQTFKEKYLCCGWLPEMSEEEFDAFPADVAPVRRGRWKYYHKQNKAVCTNCSFERDLSADFGAAIACPNCGAVMEKE